MSIDRIVVATVRSLSLGYGHFLIRVPRRQRLREFISLVLSISRMTPQKLH